MFQDLSFQICVSETVRQGCCKKFGDDLDWKQEKVVETHVDRQGYAVFAVYR